LPSHVDQLASTSRTTGAVVSDVIAELDDTAPEAAAIGLLQEVVEARGGPSAAPLEQLVAWCEANVESPLATASLIAVANSAHPTDAWLRATTLVLVARSVAVGGLVANQLDVQPVDVVALGAALQSYWVDFRKGFPHEWLYHPRKVDLSGFVRQKFISDLASASDKFRALAHVGKIACDLNVPLAAAGRNKTMDFVIGVPLVALTESKDAAQPLRKAKLSRPLLTIEIKACMTSHRQATTRLVDELTSSVDVVKGVNPEAIAVALVLVNVSQTFTNPLRLPGPNKHSERDVERLFRRLRERVPLDRGSGRERAYGAVGIDVVSIDNEALIDTADPARFVPESHSYATAVARARALFERLQAL
jgi:hypothetical protein